MNEAQILLLTAASIAFLHTILGADHYLVFTAMGKAHAWSLARTLRVTLYCGIAHVFGSVVLGLVGILFGTQLATIISIESFRGNLASWAMIAFGLMYFAWGMKSAGRSRRHSHAHAHDGYVHVHEHDHHDGHGHVHRVASGNRVTPWALFMLFVLGPCEALIPLFMYPAARDNGLLVVAVALLFGTVTILTMLGCVAVTMRGLERLRLPVDGKYAQAIAGASVAMCGAVIAMLGL